MGLQERRVLPGHREGEEVVSGKNGKPANTCPAGNIGPDCALVTYRHIKCGKRRSTCITHMRDTDTNECRCFDGEPYQREGVWP